MCTLAQRAAVAPASVSRGESTSRVRAESGRKKVRVAASHAARMRIPRQGPVSLGFRRDVMMPTHKWLCADRHGDAGTRRDNRLDERRPVVLHDREIPERRQEADRLSEQLDPEKPHQERRGS